MLELKDYNSIKHVRDESPFTCKIHLKKYIDQVRFRMSQWYGINIDDISDNDVFNELCQHDNIQYS